MANRLSKKERKTLNTVLIVLGVFLLTFIVTMIVIFCIYQTIPDTLVTCVLGAGGIEAVATAAITITKNIYKKEE